MNQMIERELCRIEEQEQARILYAAESGSRAWGFASPDSDYDVRFIYIRPRDEYLRLDSRRDVIERPIDQALDISGWDLTKALRLLYKSNPSLYEWMASPVVYRRTEFSSRLTPLMALYFDPDNSLFHYRSMAARNYRDSAGAETVKAKKYFYVLRPLLACRYVERTGKPTPMLFRELVNLELPAALRPDVERLLDLKMNAPETQLVPRVPRLDGWITGELDRIGQKSKPLKKQRGWAELNRFFLQELERTQKEFG